MGAVFLVEHVHTGDRAALKVLQGAASQDPESIERFKREARAPARIQSENVVRVLDADTIPLLAGGAPELAGAPFLVMELLNGNDLQKLVAQRGPLPPEEVARVLGQVARALDKAHAMGIVHRDLKPENLFLHTREDGTSVVKILDFGISKLDESMVMTGAQFQLTRDGAVMGTPLYMALEQAMGRRDQIGPQTDIWALGLIAIFLLTGEAYWQGKTIPDILGKVLAHAMYAPSARWPQLPQALDRWLLRSCARMPEQRFRTAGEQVAELSEILRAAQVAVVSSAPTMLPTPAFAPASFTPPYVTPPHVTPPPYVTPPYVTPPYITPQYPSGYPGAIGGSTNEPLMHTARSAPDAGMSTGAKVGIVAFVLLAFAAVVGALVVFVVIKPFEEKPAAPTYTPPPAYTAPVATTENTIEPLASTAKPQATTAPTAPTATATATATATVTATSTARAGVTREQCKASCKTACFDATDAMDCTTKCLRACPK